MSTPSQKTAYMDPFSGISGDMLLGALIDLGFPLENLERAIAGLKIPGCSLKVERTKKKGISAVKFHVLVEQMERRHAHLKDVVGMIESSSASPGAKGLADRIFHRIAEAEAKVHGTSVDKIHFHEVGAVDSIVDVLGAAMAIDYFGFHEIIAGPVNTGSGTVKCDHGVLPVPAPAVAELLMGIPSYSSGESRELTTPTGAAILATVATSFGPLPLMEMEKSGYGAGHADLPDSPNVLRIIQGTPVKKRNGEELLEMETNIDDMNPECYEYVMDLLFQAGALDVYLTPIIMKKSRPAVKLSVLCEEQKAAEMRRLLFRETSTFGVRERRVTRNKIERTMKTVETEHGPVEVKTGFLDGFPIRISPEYESCAKAAREKGVPIQEVFNAAREAALR
ncbi:MAG: nickel pincer cofactor biosynthesis protein LarC [Nitrospinae bacterium]|nr:nickel pincer cofactor biosynthesis protein LarC [Nitrospinota bacterium]